MTIFEILTLIFILFTMGVSLGNLWLNLKKQKSAEKIDLSKLELEQKKAGWNFMMELFPIKDYADLALKDPEAFKQKLDELKEKTKKLKELMKED